MIHVPSYSFYVFNYITPFFGYSVSLLDEVPSQGNLTVMQKQEYKKTGKLRMNFPLAFMKSGDLHSLSMKTKKAGMHLELHTGRILSKSQIEFIQKKISSKKFSFPVSYLVTKKEYIDTISAIKYFVAIKGEYRILKGNGFVEANSANCLILLEKDLRIVHQKIITKDMLFDGIDGLIKKIKFYEQNPLEYQKALKKQQNIIDLHYFEYPQSLLLEAWKLYKSEKVKMSWSCLTHIFLDYFFTLTYPLVWILLIPSYRMIFFFFKKGC